MSQLILSGSCHNCSLSSTRKKIVWGEGPTPCRIMFIGEAPGQQEDRTGRPFFFKAKAGREFNHILRRFGMEREDVFVSNMVLCHPPKDADPTEEQIAACSRWLDLTLEMVKPEIIVTMGQFSTRYFLGDVAVEQVHGFPYQVNGRTIVPVYHPAAALHNEAMFLQLQDDFETVRKVYYGLLVEAPKDLVGAVQYVEVHALTEIPFTDRISIDTESTSDGKLWCLTVGLGYGQVLFIRADDTVTIKALATLVANPGVETVIHNILYDLPLLRSIGVIPAHAVDTMIMAYLLQRHPQGLKPLAYRLAGMHMKSYSETVAPATHQQTMDYLRVAVELDWPDPESVLEWRKGEPHIKKPQNIGRKIKSILKGVEEKGVDPWARWQNIAVEEGRGMVEDTLGVLREGDLSMVPFEEALHYACQDADATLRIVPLLWRQIQDAGLEEVFAVDMATTEMVADMMQVGFKIDPERFSTLQVYLQEKADKLQANISSYAGGKLINPVSWLQVGDLLYNILKLPQWKGESTDDKALASLVTKHPVVQMIRDYRAYHTLIVRYASVVPKYADAQQRVHTSFRITRVATGRLSCSSPNLLAQPVRSEEGVKLRNGFLAADGFTLASFDLEQIEMRIAALMSQDPVMMQVFLDGIDIHTKTACDVFGLTPDKVDPLKHRYPCKRVGFGVLYGIGPQGLREQFVLNGLDPAEWTEDRCEEFINAWFDIYKRVRSFMSEVQAHAIRTGYVRDLWGRIRYVPGVWAADKGIKQEALRQAANGPIQMGSQGVIKRAMRDLVPIYRWLRRTGVTVNPLLQIHDDLLWEIKEEHALTVGKIIKHTIDTCVTLAIPTPCDCKMGKHWGEMEKVKL